MYDAECELCGLPAPSSEDGPDFCCEGCRRVHEAVGEVPETAESDEVEGSAEAPGTEDAFLFVEGMHCSTCELFLESVAEDVEGVEAAEASYATDTVRAVYDAEEVDEEAVAEEVDGYGYTVRTETGGKGTEETEKLRLIIGGFVGLLVMQWYIFFLYPSYLGIGDGEVLAGFARPATRYIPLLLVAVMASVVLFYTGYPILRGAYVSLRARQPNMDLLVALAAVSAYVYSTVAVVLGDVHIYYDVSVAVVMAVSVGNYYEKTVKRRSTELLSELTSAHVNEAELRDAEGTRTVPVEELEEGDEVVVRSGERVPVDGTVIEGTAAVDVSVVTGESLPETKGEGDNVVGGSVVTDNALVVEVGEGARSTLDRLTETLWRVQSGSHGAQRLADRLATVFVPLIILVGATVFVYRLASGTGVSEALLSALTVLVVSCPCAVGLATPLAVASGLREALNEGVVVTNGSVFEEAGETDTVVFDKTGTVTHGDMSVRRLHGDEETARKATAVERFSSHPVSDAFVDEFGVPDATVEGFETETKGVTAVVDGERAVAGSVGEFERRGWEVDGASETARRIRHDGGLPVLVGVDGEVRAVVEVGDTTRDGFEEAVERFDGRTKILLTGDDEEAAERFSDDFDRVLAGVPPDGKMEALRRFSDEGTTTMVGDGTNDAPALAEADVGIAVGSATALASDAADAVVMTDDLTDVPVVFDIAEGTRRRIRQNIGWALTYNAVAVPLAVVGAINPLFAAVAMATSSLLVVLNSSRSIV
ncbi:cation-translocating P-type ATPase [Haladaptatus sp. F3-133]|uniref:Cation-translocating P-type ATPase n=1 Tax=Halorutilus salinus TaxID=2487751 RepID=A0A9Q4C5N1_9EURY|nr:cation-translocating P-type ATPase [Halorutilus salinus]